VIQAWRVNQEANWNKNCTPQVQKVTILSQSMELQKYAEHIEHRPKMKGTKKENQLPQTF
jgi:hypothetical protein